MTRHFVFCLFSFLLPGCFILRSKTAERIETIAKPVTGFTFIFEFKELKTTPLDGSSRHFTALKVEFRSDVRTVPANDFVQGICYLPKFQKGKRPGILVYPILGGGDPISQGMGKALAKAGMVALVLKQKKEIFKKEKLDLKFTDSVMRQAVVDGRKALTWLQQRPEVDADSLGCVGISMGGMLACLLHAIDDRVKASVWLLAGGDLVDLMAHTREPSIRRVRERFFEQSGLTEESFKEKYRGAVLDPLSTADRIHPSKVLMVNATFDRVVPKRNRLLLWDAAGRPARRLVPLGHFSSLLVLPMVKRWTVSFLREQLWGQISQSVHRQSK